MRLIELSSDKPSFKTIRFNPDGLTLIVGDGARDSKQDGSSNGAGKTLALGLVHHCLGANVDAKIKAAVPDWIFSLKISLNQKEHIIERSGDGKTLVLDGKSIKIIGLRNWLNDCGAFRIDPQIEGLSFRSLVRRFTRHEREDCIDPLKTNRETPFDAQLRSIYLLGLDCSLVQSKRSYKNELDALKQTSKTWQHDRVLKDMFRAGSQPKVRAEWLEREIPRIKHDLDNFQIAEDYRSIELQAAELTSKIRENEKKAAIIRFQLEGIDKALNQQPDISREELLSLYEGLQTIFKPEVLAHFDAVEKFHHSLAANRKARLEQDRLTLHGELDTLEAASKEISEKRDQQLQMLQGKHALDEYAALANQLAILREEQHRLNEFLNFSASLKQREQQIKEKKIEEDRTAGEYLRNNPIANVDSFFSSLAELLYPRTPAGIVIENNTGDNQIRYDLTVQIEGDASDGINAARILCFDWLLLMHGANHSMDFLWHDNRLFADIDPKPRAAWFAYVMASLPKTGKQYIATINTENFVAMKDHLTPEQMESLNKAIRLTLRGDKPENKLLGIQFGSQQ
jgi:uncharacterized protein YydD (DUF2326 family)